MLFQAKLDDKMLPIAFLVLAVIGIVFQGRRMASMPPTDRAAGHDAAAGVSGAKAFRRRLNYARARSKRSRFITLFQAATKSWTNFCCASELP